MQAPTQVKEWTNLDSAYAIWLVYDKKYTLNMNLNNISQYLVNNIN